MLPRFIKFFDTIANSAVLLLLGIVAVNIIARQFHELSSGIINFMISGAIELSRYFLLILVFFALPKASSHEMVRVDILRNLFPSSLRSLMDKLWVMLMATFMATLCVLFIKKGIVTFQRGDATQDLLMPLFYFYGLISLASLASALSCLVKALHIKGSA